MSVIDEVKSRLDIVEVISAYIPLQKAGRNYKALCPFHSEKTPSFVVFPESERWHCFGACGEGGDIFTFVMKREGWDFRTALEELARRAGVELRPRTPAQKQAEEEADRLRELLAAAARYYHHLLLHALEAEAVRDYVAKRGLSDETVEQFSLGYSLPGWDNARAYLTEQGYTVDEIIKVGMLVQKADTGSTYDRFRDRLMIPIRDVKGHVIGFGARTLDPEGVPKYLNSPQTAFFDKSHTLFGLDMARRAIRDEDRAVIVEGYMDVMQAHQAGFSNVVAQMGTALTEAQLRQLQRYTKRLVLALDPDAAGINATLRGVEVAQETLEQEWEPVFDPRGLVGYEGRLGAEIRVLRLPRGQDPDDLIRAGRGSGVGGGFLPPDVAGGDRPGRHQGQGPGSRYAAADPAGGDQPGRAGGLRPKDRQGAAGGRTIGADPSAQRRTPSRAASARHGQHPGSAAAGTYGGRPGEPLPVGAFATPRPPLADR